MIDVNEQSPRPLLLLGTTPATGTDSPILYHVNGEEIVVTRQSGSWCGFVNRCPHAGAPLTDGVCADGTVTCGVHAWTFDLFTGNRIGNWGGSNKFSLEMRSIEEQNGMLYLRQPTPEAEIIGTAFLIRYGIPGWVSKFRGPDSIKIAPREGVLIRTERGIEEGELLAIQPREKLAESMGELLRPLVDSDVPLRNEKRQRAEECLALARKVGNERHLPQEFVDAEALWEGETVIIYYLGNHGLELADLAESISLHKSERVQFQPLIEPPPESGCGCGSGGCHS